MGEDGSFLMELLKIASSNQIRSIKILSRAVAEKSKTRTNNTESCVLVNEQSYDRSHLFSFV